MLKDKFKCVIIVPLYLFCKYCNMTATSPTKILKYPSPPFYFNYFDNGRYVPTHLQVDKFPNKMVATMFGLDPEAVNMIKMQ